MDERDGESKLWRLKRLRRNASKRYRNRCLNANEMRKQNRHKIVNTRRGLNDEWLDFDPNERHDRFDVRPYVSADMAVVVSQLVAFDGNEDITRNTIAFVRQWFADGDENHNFAIDSNVFAAMAALLNNHHLTGVTKIEVLYTIESSIGYDSDINAVINSGLISSIMANITTCDQLLATEGMRVLRVLFAVANDFWLRALQNGYMQLIVQLINATYLQIKRKSLMAKSLSDVKLNLIKELSDSLYYLCSNLLANAMPNDLNHINGNLLFACNKLINFPEVYVKNNVLLSLQCLVEKTPNILCNLYDGNLISNLYDLFESNRESLIKSSVMSGMVVDVKNHILQSLTP